MKKILLVNPFSSAAYLSSRLKEYDVHSTALYTLNLEEIPNYVALHKTLFDQQITDLSNDAKRIIDSLGNAKFDYIINGFETSVKLSDQLAQYYTPQYANNPDTYKLRCDKYKMHNALKKSGMPHIQQNIFDTKIDRLREIKDYGLEYPVFVKPLYGAASFGANKIENQHELHAYFKDAAKHNNFVQTDESRGKVLISEYINGVELFVDTFSMAGQHHISTIQRYYKEYYNGRPVYRYCELERDEEIKQKITKIINQVLDVTGYKNGFAHTEFFLLNNGDIKLIEINPRISGALGIIDKIAFLNSGKGVVSLLMHYIFGYKLFKGDNKHYRCLHLYNMSGKSLHNLEEHLKKYRTVVEVIQLVPECHIIKDMENISLIDTAAFVLLGSCNIQDIEDDTRAIFGIDT